MLNLFARQRESGMTTDLLSTFKTIAGFMQSEEAQLIKDIHPCPALLLRLTAD